jgi:hypothetical protein
MAGLSGLAEGMDWDWLLMRLSFQCMAEAYVLACMKRIP